MGLQTEGLISEGANNQNEDCFEMSYSRFALVFNLALIIL